ncbi:Structural maintenance of chromosomes protein 3 [Entomophthora muscae]|uniref:Structural maintenance of chromosomes protein 3 n=1 Tax=Entomophthora muscae TaxID=34485 RepID=A0ACC2T0H9_9FUNG|nr:Structural maintenance of chromosomes protein 3 [Entomophthora muscae]
MYIKQIIIQGFKSYKDQTVIEPFSPNHNVIIGRNGSGKSNFFAAIRFVLSDAYNNLSREERQSLLHEGAGPANMSAFVEVIFDNSDHRFPNNKDEMILRRSIGLKKDEYSIDRKAYSKSEVMNLLESAGFSRSNPYYIVPQGRVTSLTHAKDHERLQLLKEVAGTRVYEERRQESLKLMKDTDQKRSKIDELIKYIQERLSELEGEKEELENFQTEDRERRCLEYALYSKEQKKVLDLLAVMEEDRAEVLAGDSKRREIYQSQEAEINEKEGQVRELQQEKDMLEIEKRQLLDERQERVKTQAQLRLTISDFETNPETSTSLKTRIEKDLKLIQKDITNTRKEHEALKPQLDQATSRTNSLQDNLDQMETQRQALYAKKGYGSQFSNEKERNQWLQKDIKALTGSIAVESESLKNLSQTQAKLEKELSDATQQMATINSTLDSQKGDALRITAELKQLRVDRDEQTDARKELWREDARLDGVVQSYKEELRKAERNLASCMDQTTAAGLETVKSIVKDLGLQGVYGPLYELFEVPEVYRTAAETTAGARLFYVVVDSDETVTRLLTEMARRKEGRVTFMPLNRLRAREHDYSRAPEALPLINQLHFDEVFLKAFQQVFGSTVICETLELASTYARTLKFDTITLDGDRADRNGALTGGFHDVRRSRLESAQAITLWRQRLENELARSRQVKREIEAKDQQVTQILSRIQVAEAERRKLVALREPLFAELALKQQHETHLLELVSQKQRAAEKLKANIAGLEAKVAFYKAELKTTFKKSLTPSEEKQLQDLNSQIDTLRSELIAHTALQLKMEADSNSLLNKLHSNLERRRIDLSKQLESFTQTDTFQGGRFLAAKRSELNAVEASIDGLSQRLREIEDKVDEKSQTIDSLNTRLINLKNKQSQADRDFEKHQKDFEQYLSHKAVLLQKREACAKNIRELGVLPEEAFTKYIENSSKKILKRLHKANATLKKYSHVNKKAFEQYNSFSQQKESLLGRKEELDQSEKDIRDLIAILDQRKDEDVARTFRQVAKEFADIFEKLVPAGQGKLVMLRRTDGDLDDHEDVDNQPGSVDNYIGIAIKVSFNNKTDEGLRMQQLSGGQKSLVALALIFAIQACDPAPFYLFDEVDANLDAAHRSAVASMVHDLARNAQFITTTFRPELLARADQFYGVTFNNKVSQVAQVTKEQATRFIETNTSA